MSGLIQAALAQGLDTRIVEIGVDVLGRTGPVFTDLFAVASAIIVADGHTWAVAGEQVRASLDQAGVRMETPIIYPGTPTLFADDHLVADLAARLAPMAAVPVSLASGSLNDVTKLASHQTSRSYLNVCTAASVDGYTSFGAAITVGGVKVTQACPAPRGVIVPLDVMAAAPACMAATGYGDLIEKLPAGADWILADELGLDPIDDVAWGLVQGPLRESLGNPSGVAAGDLSAITALAEGLIASGLAMQVHSSSRPASGGGHYFSHQWEMEGYGRDWEPPLSHGFKVGLGTLSMCALYEAFLAKDLSGFDPGTRLAAWPTPAQDEARVRALQPHPVIREAALKQSQGKYVPRDQARARLDLIRQRFSSIQTRVAAQVLPAHLVARMLKEAGAIHHPAQIGLSLDDLRTTYYQAQTIRTRYTLLDLLQDLGWFSPLVDSLFAPGGYWYARAHEVSF